MGQPGETWGKRATILPGCLTLFIPGWARQVGRMAPRYMLIVAHLPRPYDGLGQVGQVAESVPGTGR